MWPKGRLDLRFDALTGPIAHDDFSILDYGCGLGHLKAYLDKRFDEFAYCGVDIVGEFIKENLRNFPDGVFREIESYKSIADQFDYVVLSGVFNLLYTDDVDRHQRNVRETLLNLFGNTKIALSVNFMTDQVDYKQPFAHHQNVFEIYEFVSKYMSPRLFLDQSYMPYEFTIVAYRDQEILRPDNVYR